MPCSSSSKSARLRLPLARPHVADAGHNLSDVLGLVLAWWASMLVKRAATERRTYGMRRSSVLAALGNAAFLLVSVGAIAWSAVLRLLVPTAVAAQTVIWVSLLGVAINTGTALMFMSGRQGQPEHPQRSCIWPPTR